MDDFTADHIAITEKSRRLSDIAFAKQISYAGRRDKIIAFIRKGIDKRNRKPGSFSRLLKEFRCSTPSLTEVKIIPRDHTACVQSFDENVLDENFRRPGGKLNGEGLLNDSIKPHET